jgi:hypothetical protein
MALDTVHQRTTASPVMLQDSFPLTCRLLARVELATSKHPTAAARRVVLPSVMGLKPRFEIARKADVELAALASQEIDDPHLPE